MIDVASELTLPVAPRASLGVTPLLHSNCRLILLRSKEPGVPFDLVVTGWVLAGRVVGGGAPWVVGAIAVVWVACAVKGSVVGDGPGVPSWTGTVPDTMDAADAAAKRVAGVVGFVVAEPDRVADLGREFVDRPAPRTVAFAFAAARAGAAGRATTSPPIPRASGEGCGT